MEAILIPLVLDVARKVGAPLIEGVMNRYLGKGAADVAGTVAGTVLDSIAEKAGVSTAELKDVPTATLEAAVKETEPQTPALVLAHVEQQKQTNRLVLAPLEADKPTWTWAWLPAWQWFLMFLWAFTWVLVPVANAALRSDIPVPSIGDLVQLTLAYLALHMGGHTVKQVASSWREAKGRPT